MLLLPIFAIFTAFGTTSAELPRYVPLKTISKQINLPLPYASLNRDEAFWQIDQVRPDETLVSLFKRMSVRDEEALKFLTISPAAQAINTQLVPGHSIKIKTNLDGKLLHLQYEIDKETCLVAEKTADGYEIATQQLELQNRAVLKSATIVNSLFGATDTAGIPDQIGRAHV